jgi:diguanylate cyclase (GGDEF)-like protein
MEEYVNIVLENAKEEEVHALYIIDLDNFKKINDSFGHSLGDNVLMETTNKLSLVFSENDILGRVGGDEFAVFLKLSLEGQKNAKTIVEFKGKAVCDILKSTYSDGNHEVKLSASVGASIFSKDGRNYGSLFLKADRALYHAKESGKNQFYIYQEFMEGDNQI